MTTLPAHLAPSPGVCPAENSPAFPVAVGTAKPATQRAYRAGRQPVIPTPPNNASPAWAYAWRGFQLDMQMKKRSRPTPHRQSAVLVTLMACFPTTPCWPAWAASLVTT